VDRIRAQWAAARPDLDTSPFAIVGRMGRAAAYFDQAIARCLDEHGLQRGSWDVLASLRRNGPPYERSPTQLYRGLMRSSGALTHRLHRLERAGLIERAPDPVDGRGLLVRLTPAGVELVDRILPLHMDNERRLIAALSSDDRAALERILRRLLGALEGSDPEPPGRRTGSRGADVGGERGC